MNRLLILQEQLEHIAPVYISAGRPSAPVGGCERIYIWLDQLSDDNQIDPSSCMVDTRTTIGIEVWSCYNDDAEDMTADTFLADAERFTDLVIQVWDALVEHKDASDLAGASRCDEIGLLPLVTTQRLGGSVSAAGAIVV